MIFHNPATQFTTSLAVSDPTGPVLGASPTVRMRHSNGNYLDFDDLTFKAAGHVQLDATMSEDGNGIYSLLINVPGIADIENTLAVFIEHHLASPAVDASETLVLAARAVPLGLSVASASGGIAGLAAVARIQDATGDYLDFNDLTFKPSAWVTLEKPLTDYGRGHYAATVQLPADPLTPLRLEFETTGAVAVAAIERYHETETVFDTVTYKPPGLGLTVAQKQLTLATLLPNGTDRYIGLFSSMPDNAGAGGVEASGSGYARVAHAAWTNSITNQVVRRLNVGNITFAALTGDLSVRGWGIWDAASGGTLLAFGRLRNDGGFPMIVSLATNDQPQFLTSELVVGIQ